MEPKKFLAEMLKLIQDLAEAKHAGENTAIAERAKEMAAQLDEVFEEGSEEPQ